MGNLRSWNRKSKKKRVRWHEPLLDQRESHVDQLRDCGIQIPRPESLDDAALGEKLWEVIHALAEQRIVLYSTDHLSDRALYSVLVDEILAQPFEPLFDGARCRIVDCVHDGSIEGSRNYLRYYAEEETRQQWLDDFWLEPMPPSEPLPYDRDRHLPVPPGMEAFFSRNQPEETWEDCHECCEAR